MDSKLVLMLIWIVNMTNGNDIYEWFNLNGTSVLTEETGTAAMIYDHWNFISMFTLSDKRMTDEFLRNCTRLARKICEVHMQTSNRTLNEASIMKAFTKSVFGNESARMTTEEPPQTPGERLELNYEHNCKSSVASVGSLAQRIIETGKKLNLIVKSYRSKRSIDPLGAVLKWAIGSMDSTDNDRITSDLNQIKHNENATFQYMHKQTTIMASTMQKLLKPIRKLEEEHAVMAVTRNQIIDRTQKEVSAMERQNQIMAIQTSVNAFLEAVNLKLEEVDAVRKEEVQTLEAVMAKRFYHNMDVMQKQYKAIASSKDNSYLDLEEPPYALIEVDIFVREEDIYFKLTIPMAADEIYDVKRVYPIPQAHDDHFHKIPVMEAS